jgi:hypothetical protein
LAYEIASYCMTAEAFAIEGATGRLQVTVSGYAHPVDTEQPDWVTAAVVLERPGSFRLELVPRVYFGGEEIAELADWLGCARDAAAGARELPRDYFVSENHLMVSAALDASNIALTIRVSNTAADAFGHVHGNVTLSLSPSDIESAERAVRRVARAFPRRLGSGQYNPPRY